MSGGTGPPQTREDTDMLVSELIEMLEGLRQKQGDVEVMCWLVDDDWGGVGEPSLRKMDSWEGFKGYVLEA